MKHAERQALRKLPEDLLSDLRGRRFSDLLLFGVTLAELGLLVLLTPAFAMVDWIYVSQHLVVLGFALTRPPPMAQDRSLPSSLAVGVSMTYPYAQVIYVDWTNGHTESLADGLVLVTVAACLSFASLLSLGRFFGLRPALRGVATRGPYSLVRHPMYLAYILSDIGYEVGEWNIGTALIVIIGWTSLLYRIHAEERMLSQDTRWRTYVGAVPYRLVPGAW